LKNTTGYDVALSKLATARYRYEG